MKSFKRNQNSNNIFRLIIFIVVALFSISELASLSKVVDTHGSVLTAITPESITLIVTASSVHTSSNHLTPVSLWLSSNTL